MKILINLAKGRATSKVDKALTCSAPRTNSMAITQQRNHKNDPQAARGKVKVSGVSQGFAEEKPTPAEEAHLPPGDEAHLPPRQSRQS